MTAIATQDALAVRGTPPPVEGPAADSGVKRLEAVAREFTGMMERLGAPGKPDPAGDVAGRPDEARET